MIFLLLHKQLCIFYMDKSPGEKKSFKTLFFQPCTSTPPKISAKSSTMVVAVEIIIALKHWISVKHNVKMHWVLMCVVIVNSPSLIWVSFWLIYGSWKFSATVFYMSNSKSSSKKMFRDEKFLQSLRYEVTVPFVRIRSRTHDISDRFNRILIMNIV